MNTFVKFEIKLEIVFQTFAQLHKIVFDTFVEFPYNKQRHPNIKQMKLIENSG